MRKLVLFFVCIGLTSFAFSQLPAPALPPPPILPPLPKPKHEPLFYNSSGELEWKGTVQEADKAFTTSREKGVDVVRDRESNNSITGSLTIVDSNGNLQGKLELKDGKLHGEEIFYDEDGNIVEENYWIEGKLSKTPPPRVKETKIQNTDNDSAKKPRPTFDPFADRPKVENKDRSVPLNSKNAINPFLSKQTHITPNSTVSKVVVPSVSPKLPERLEKAPRSMPAPPRPFPVHSAIKAKISPMKVVSEHKLNSKVPYDSHWLSKSMLAGSPLMILASCRNLKSHFELINLKEGIKHGFYQSRTQNNVLEAEGNFSEGIETGFWRFWYPDGSIMEEIIYNEGEIYSANVWMPNGEKCTKTNLKEGDGIYIIYHSNNSKKILKSCEIKLSNKLLTYFKLYHDGKPSLEESYHDGKADGTWTEWYHNGKIKEKKIYRRGILFGPFIRWHENGQKLAEYFFDKGLRNGVWTEWYENGQKRVEVSYDNNKKDGVWTEWYKNGQKWVEVSYDNNKENGVWTEWYENGQKRVECNYFEGSPDGIWTEWYKDGQKKGTKQYSKGKLASSWRSWKSDGKEIRISPKGPPMHPNYMPKTLRKIGIRSFPPPDASWHQPPKPSTLRFR